MLVAAWTALTFVAPIVLHTTFGGDCAGPDLCPGPPKIVGDAYLVDFWLWLAAGIGVTASIRWPRRWLFAALSAIAAGLIGQSLEGVFGPSQVLFALFVLPGALTALVGGLAGVRVMSDPQSRWSGNLAPGVMAGVLLYTFCLVSVGPLLPITREGLDWIPLITVVLGVAAVAAIRLLARRQHA
jgi:hypothetical protein